MCLKSSVCDLIGAEINGMEDDRPLALVVVIQIVAWVKWKIIVNRTILNLK